MALYLVRIRTSNYEYIQTFLDVSEKVKSNKSRISILKRILDIHFQIT